MCSLNGPSSNNHLEMFSLEVFSLPEPTWIVCLVFRQYSLHKEGLAPWFSLDLVFPLLCFEYTHKTLPLLHLVPKYSLFLVYLEIQWIVVDGDNSAMYKIKKGLRQCHSMHFFRWFQANDKERCISFTLEYMYNAWTPWQVAKVRKMLCLSTGGCHF